MGKNNKNIIDFANRRAAQIAKNNKQAVVPMINNTNLIKAMNNFKASSGVENWAGILNEVVVATVLVPSNFNEEKKPMPVVVKSKEGKSFQPVFTDKDSVPDPKSFPHQGVIGMPFIALAQIIVKQSVGVEGIVINFTGQNIIINKDILEQMVKFDEDKKAGKIDKDEKLIVSIPQETQSIGVIKDGGVSQVPLKDVDPQTTIEVKNPELEELADAFRESKTNEDLYNLASKLMESRVLLPGKLNDKKVPVPVTVTGPDGLIIQPVFTEKSHIPEDPKAEVVLNMPFDAVVTLVLTEGVTISGIGINAFDKAVIIKKEYFAKLRDSKLGEAANGATALNNLDPTTLSDKDYAIYQRARFEMQKFPELFFKDASLMIEKLASEKEEYLDSIFEECYEDVRRYPYLPEDFKVMIMNASDSQKVAIINTPSQDVSSGIALEIYLVMEQGAENDRYFAITEGPVKGKRNLLEINKDGQVKMYGDAPEEGTELNYILKLLDNEE